MLELTRTRTRTRTLEGSSRIGEARGLSNDVLRRRYGGVPVRIYPSVCVYISYIYAYFYTTTKRPLSAPLTLTLTNTGPLTLTLILH